MRSILRAMLLCSTALVVPSPAKSGVLLPFLSGLTGGAIFTTSGIVASISGGIGGAAFAAGSFLGGTFLGQTILGLGINAAVSAASRRNIPQQTAAPQSATLANFAQPISYIAQKYGKSRVGGPIGFTGAGNDRRFYVPIFAAHEIDGFEQHWLDEYTVGIDATVVDQGIPNIITREQDPQYTAPGEMREYGRIDAFRGAAGQAANAFFVSVFDEVTSDYDFAGLAGAVVWAKKPPPEVFTKTFPRGREWAYTPVIRGDNNIFDPRDSTFKYTANAALVIAHWITEILGRSVDWNLVAGEANVCDVVVGTRFEGFIPLWEINGGLTDDQSFEAQRQALATACDAYFFELPNGAVGFYVGRWIQPAVTVTAADCIQVSVSSDNTGAATEIAAIYVDQTSTWREASSGTIILATDENQVREEVPANMVIYHNQASRIAKRVGKTLRPEARMSGIIGTVGYQLRAQRFFTLVHPGAPDGSQFFEITMLKRINPVQFEIEAISVEPSDFDFNAAAEEPDRPSRALVDSAFVTPDITGVTAVASASSSITVSWDAQEGYLWQQVRWKTTAETAYQTATIEGGETQYNITGLVDGQTYQVQARNASGVSLASPSAWQPVTPLSVTVIANSTPPAALAAFTATVNGSDVDLAWTPPNDPNYFGVILYRGATSLFADASAIHTEYASSGVLTYTDVAPGTGDFYYFAQPINSSGLGGTETAAPVVTI